MTTGRIAAAAFALAGAACSYSLALTAPTALDTGIAASSLDGAHTLAVRYLPQFEATSLAPMVSVSGADQYWLAINDEEIDVSIRAVRCRAPLTNPVQWTGSRVPIPRWRHLAVTVDAARSVVLYQDGVAMGACANAGAAGVAGTILLGRRERVGGIQPQFNGLIDDVVLYPRALTAAQVAELAAGGAPSGYAAKLDFEGSKTPGRVRVSGNRDAASDRRAFLVPTIVFDRLPFPDGEGWRIVQAWNDAGNSHHGQAVFSLDLSWVKPSDVAAHQATPSEETEGRPLVSVLTTTVDDARDTGDPCKSNHVRLLVGADAYLIYLHLVGGVTLAAGDPIAIGAVIGAAGDSGVIDAGGNCAPLACCHRSKDDHLHFAVANNVPRPYVFAQYQVSTDQGGTWTTVRNAFPYRREWIRAVPLAPTPRCQTADQCPAGNFCIANQCWPPPRHCRESRDCGPGALCRRGDCVLY